MLRKGKSPLTFRKKFYYNNFIQITLIIYNSIILSFFYSKENLKTVGPKPDLGINGLGSANDKKVFYIFC